MRRDVAQELEQLGLSQYVDRLAHEGFDNWASLCDITESDLEALQVLRGHRRILLRHVATLRGHPCSTPLDDGSSDGHGHGHGNCDDDDCCSSQSRSTSRRPSLATIDNEETGRRSSTGTTKRKYRRHPKADENAPPRPPSAYVMFANQVRDDEKDAKFSFTQLARVVGERWKNLDAAQKERIESAAAERKRIYLAETAEYRKSSEYQLYQDYLSEFKARAMRDEKPERLIAPKRAHRRKTSDASSTKASPEYAIMPVPDMLSQHRPVLVQHSSSESVHREHHPSLSSITSFTGEPDTRQLPHLNMRLPSMQVLQDPREMPMQQQLPPLRGFETAPIQLLQPGHNVYRAQQHGPDLNCYSTMGTRFGSE